MTTTNQRAVLFSIHPLFVDKILAGQKTVELRRRFPEEGLSGSTAMIYCTSPVKAVVGSAQITDVYKLPLLKLWTLVGIIRSPIRVSIPPDHSGHRPKTDPDPDSGKMMGSSPQRPYKAGIVITTSCYFAD